MSVAPPKLAKERLECHAANMLRARVLAPPLDLVGCATFRQLEAALRAHATCILGRYVVATEPLRQELAAWIWFRTDGTMVEEQTDCIGEERHPIDACHDLPLAIFPPLPWATPDSMFYRRVPDARGPYVGSVNPRWRGLPPPWRPRSQRGPRVYYEVLPRFGMRVSYRSFRLEPMSGREISQQICQAQYQQVLKQDFQAWLAMYGAKALLPHQCYPSLAAAIKQADPMLVEAVGGCAAFRKLALSKAEEHLRRQLAWPTPRAEEQ